jgi:hypothetical protein
MLKQDMLVIKWFRKGHKLLYWMGLGKWSDMPSEAIRFDDRKGAEGMLPFLYRRPEYCPLKEYDPALDRFAVVTLRSARHSAKKNKKPARLEDA